MRKILFILLCSTLVVQAQKTASVNIRFDNFIGNEPLVLNEKQYRNAAGNEFNVSLFQYFASNIQLIKKDGTVYTVPQEKSYFLIRESNEASKTITIDGVPAGRYSGMRFIIGVDSARSASDIGARKGCLDVAGEASDMYWAWNSGYIFVKMEGNSPQPDKESQLYMYHIGLFGGIGSKKTLNNIRMANIDFGKETLVVKEGKRLPHIRIKTDGLKMMNGTTNVDIIKNPSVMSSPFSANIAENYKEMFSFNGLIK